MDARIRTSFSAFSFSFSERESILTFLRAYSSVSPLRFTLKTEEYAPSPSFFIIVKSLMREPYLIEELFVVAACYKP